MARSASQAILLVDGYNMIGAWSRLQQIRDQHGLEDARRDLVELLVGYSAFQDFETEVVFDAQFQGTPSVKEDVTRNLKICYTNHLQTADSYIEQMCAQFRNDIRRFEKRLIVATSDRAQQLTVEGYGAECMSAHRLQADIEQTAHRILRKQRQKGRSRKGFLLNSLDPAAQQQLIKMRFGEPL